MFSWFTLVWGDIGSDSCLSSGKYIGFGWLSMRECREHLVTFEYEVATESSDTNIQQRHSVMVVLYLV